MKLLGVRETADLLGVSTARIYNLDQDSTRPRKRRKPPFPQPIERLRATPVWKREDIETWAKATGRALANNNTSARPRAEPRPRVKGPGSSGVVVGEGGLPAELPGEESTRAAPRLEDVLRSIDAVRAQVDRASRSQSKSP